MSFVAPKSIIFNSKKFITFYIIYLFKEHRKTKIIEIINKNKEIFLFFIDKYYYKLGRE